MKIALRQQHLGLLSRVIAILVALATLNTVSYSFAGGGPENVFLIVNSTSQGSKMVANHYIDLRNIPAPNVFYVEQDETEWRIDSRNFKKDILLPALKAMDERGIRGQIDYVIYSCGFPGMVSFHAEFPNEKYSTGYQARGSITGSTYLWAFAVEKRKEMFAFSSNNYCLPKPGTISLKNDLSKTRAFRGSYRWLPSGARAANAIPYFLSTQLGVTYGQGNTAEEIVRYLRTAKEADESHPKGTVYYMKHDGPRSKPRHDLFPQAVEALKQAGVKAEILNGKFPQGKNDVMGLTMGSSIFNISTSKSQILPGALCDNLTSTSGRFLEGHSQTLISNFLGGGAAGACGTVLEPLAIPNKFPTPFLHVHYARGCSMAEAFYHSIYAPFQQLILGDPLCQPWAHFPEVTVRGIPPGKFVKGSITLVPTAVAHEDRGISFFELFINGVRRKRCRPGGKFQLDTTTLADGYHELRVVAIDDTPMETQGRWLGRIEVNNQRKAIRLTLENKQQLANAKHAIVKVASIPKMEVTLLHNGREVGQVASGSGTVQLASDLLGTGPIVIQARAEGEKGVLSPPLRFKMPAAASK